MIRAGILAALVVLSVDARAEEAAALVSRLCGQCHEVRGLETPRGRLQGPTLAGLIGRRAGSVEGFEYSGAMVEAGRGGLVWSRATLARYLAEPQAVVPGTFMAAPALRNVGEIAKAVAFVAGRGS